MSDNTVSLSAFGKREINGCSEESKYELGDVTSHCFSFMKGENDDALLPVSGANQLSVSLLALGGLVVTAVLTVVY